MRQNLGKLLAIVIFGLAFGQLEAIVVYYLQTILGSGTQYLTSGYKTLLNLGVVAFIVPNHPILKSVHLVSIEMLREAATIFMLVTLSFVAAKNSVSRLGAFLISFGLWDIFYYVSLFFLIGWPRSLFDLDVFFLIPVAWVGPVITPLVISSTFVVLGIALFTRNND